MDAPASTYLPQLEGSPAGSVTLHELVTHTAGYDEFGASTLRRAGLKAPLGQNFLTADSSQMTQETRDQTLTDRGSFAYATLGTATAGQAVSALLEGTAPGLAALEPTKATDQSNTRVGDLWRTST